MKKFIKKIILYFLTTLFILALVAYLRYDKNTYARKNPDSRVFLKKKLFFQNFIENKKSINLILGSSLIEDSIIPDSLGSNWFSFTNGGQNIYNSYKFLDYYKNSIKIDTIIIGLQPFDFPSSYIKNAKEKMPIINIYFSFFGNDSIFINRFSLLNRIQSFKDDFIPSLRKFENNQQDALRDIWSEQGYSGRIYKEIRKLDSLHVIKKSLDYDIHAHAFFYNVNKNPNLKYFDLFNNLLKSSETELIYIITPKSKYYNLDLINFNYSDSWHNVLDSLKSRNAKIWNYENINTDTVDFDWFWDDTHSSYNGAKAFTKIIKKRLRD